MVHIVTNTIKYLLLASGITFSLLAAKIAGASEIIDIPVLQQTVTKGTIITEGMLSAKQYDARRVPRSAITNAEMVIGQEALRTIRANRPLQARQLRVPPHSRKGQAVTVKYQKGGMVLMTAGQLMSDASLGEEVAVRTNSSKDPIFGKVVAKGLVEVH